MTDSNDTPFVKKRAPTLYGIIAIKLAKGLLFMSAAVALYVLSDNNLPDEFQHLLHWLRFNPERKFFHELALQIGKLTEANMIFAGTGSFIYSLFSLIEGIGMIFRVSWAGWMAIGESAFFVPIEVYELVRGFTWTVFLILIVNIVIVWYLFQNRHRLFRHHHHHHHEEPEVDVESAPDI